jgi:hypothetical protein
MGQRAVEDDRAGFGRLVPHSDTDPHPHPHPDPDPDAQADPHPQSDPQADPHPHPHSPTDADTHAAPQRRADAGANATPLDADPRPHPVPDPIAIHQLGRSHPAVGDVRLRQPPGLGKRRSLLLPDRDQ